ncbi:MAG: hypothetical protein V7L13_31705 [Nostoc sp.]|uniref:hypothetical protein n=1 Tax=Nostoc sp. TaxID=1180 RepID=UPI002FFA1133
MNCDRKSPPNRVERFVSQLCCWESQIRDVRVKASKIIARAFVSVMGIDKSDRVVL